MAWLVCWARFVRSATESFTFYQQPPYDIINGPCMTLSIGPRMTLSIGPRMTLSTAPIWHYQRPPYDIIYGPRMTLSMAPIFLSTFFILVMCAISQSVSPPSLWASAGGRDHVHGLIVVCTFTVQIWCKFDQLGYCQDILSYHNFCHASGLRFATINIFSP